MYEPANAEKLDTSIALTAPYALQRWIVFGVLFALFLLRVFVSQGWYIVAYALGIYLLNILLLFLSPRIDPALDPDLDLESETIDNVLPTHNDEEFRPFIRRLPEFSFWRSGTTAVSISLLLTTSRTFDIPVFWPILLVYFCLLFYVTMRRQIQHMIKYRYLPFDFGKRRYSST